MCDSEPAAQDLSGALRTATTALAEALARETVSEIPERDLQQLFAAAARAYARRSEADPAARPFAAQDGVTATDVALAATGMLMAAEIAVFELGMWQTIKGRG